MSTTKIDQVSLYCLFIILIASRIQKNKHKFNFHYVAMPMMALQILKSVDLTKSKI